MGTNCGIFRFLYSILQSTDKHPCFYTIFAVRNQKQRPENPSSCKPSVQCCDEDYVWMNVIIYSIELYILSISHLLIFKDKRDLLNNYTLIYIQCRIVAATTLGCYSVTTFGLSYLNQWVSNLTVVMTTTYFYSVLQGFHIISNVVKIWKSYGFVTYR